LRLTDPAGNDIGFRWTESIVICVSTCVFTEVFQPFNTLKPYVRRLYYGITDSVPSPSLPLQGGDWDGVGHCSKEGVATMTRK
jgi:hypothetical protein